jgi:CRISPR/Cas system-associated endonuclease/helicase Cas3
MELRDYQERDLGRLREAMRSTRRVLYVAPTGSGKTVLFAAIAQGAAAPACWASPPRPSGSTARGWATPSTCWWTAPTRAR